MPDLPPDLGLAQLAAHAEVARFLHGVLDQRDRKGRFPATFTVRGTEGAHRELERFLPPAVLRRGADGRVVVQLARLQDLLERQAADRGTPAPSLEELFGSLVGREPRDLSRERAGWREQLAQALREGAERGRERAQRAGVLPDMPDGAPDGAPSRMPDGAPGGVTGTRRAGDALLEAHVRDAIEAALAGRGRWLRHSREVGLDAVRERFARLVAAFLIARAPRKLPLRLDELSLLAAGDTKAFRPGSEDHRLLAAALLAGEPEQGRELLAEPGTSRALRERLFLERLGIVTNESPLDVLVRGDVAFELGGERFDDAARLARHGIASKLTWSVIRAAERIETRAAGVLSVENETAFHRCAAALPEHLVVFTAGQPSWPLTRLLARLAEARPELPFEHAGDLDLPGLEILRVLRRRTGLGIAPRWMDVETFEGCLDLALPMQPDEHRRVQSALGAWNESFGQELLERLAATGRWIEQEQVLVRLLGR